MAAAVRREEASAKANETYGRLARQFVSYRDVMALKDIDAVMIASPDHMHTTHLKAVVEAGKDAYWVPQPLHTSLSLRNTWLLPEDIGSTTEYLGAGFSESRSGVGVQKRDFVQRSASRGRGWGFTAINGRNSSLQYMTQEVRFSCTTKYVPFERNAHRHAASDAS